MNEVRRIDRGEADLQVAREVVERHRQDFPPFVEDFDVKLGYPDGDPALFILYKTTGEGEDWPSAEWQARADAYRRLDDAILPKLINALDGRFPYSFLVPDWQWGYVPGLIVPEALIASALAVFEQPEKIDELTCRRAISAAYYGLFHTLVDAAARVVAADDGELLPVLVRAYSHSTIRRVCEAIKQPKSSGSLLPAVPSPQIEAIARVFAQLQKARELADYDLRAPIGRSYAQAQVQSAGSALAAFEAVRYDPGTRRFLIALLIADRLKSRG